MSEIITKLGPLAEGVARLIDPDGWDNWDRRVERKQWTDAEAAEEFADEIARGRRLTASLQKAQAVLAFVIGQAEKPPVLDLTPAMEVRS